MGDSGIVLITARDGLQDRLRGLDGGADDYVVKPFELTELYRGWARCCAGADGCRRCTGGRPDAGRRSRCCCARWSSTDLTATELRLLAYLVEQRGRTVSAARS